MTAFVGVTPQNAGAVTKALRGMLASAPGRAALDALLPDDRVGVVERLKPIVLELSARASMDDDVAPHP